MHLTGSAGLSSHPYWARSVALGINLDRRLTGASDHYLELTWFTWRMRMTPISDQGVLRRRIGRRRRTVTTRSRSAACCYAGCGHQLVERHVDSRDELSKCSRERTRVGPGTNSPFLSIIQLGWRETEENTPATKQQVWLPRLGYLIVVHRCCSSQAWVFSHCVFI